MLGTLASVYLFLHHASLTSDNRTRDTPRHYLKNSTIIIISLVIQGVPVSSSLVKNECKFECEPSIFFVLT